MRISAAAARLCIIATITTHPLAGFTLRPHHPQTAHVRFIATSISVRGMHEGEDEDIYLVELSLKGSDYTPIVAQLIDEYPGWQTPIRTDDLKSHAGITLRLVRDMQCDTPFGALTVRSAPGDPIAVLPEQMVFRPILPRVIHANETLPCFRVVRRNTSLPVQIRTTRASRDYQ